MQSFYGGKGMNDEILGYDCDGVGLHEFDIVTAMWSEDIDFDNETEIDPRKYCVVKAFDNKSYLISVYDSCNRKAINRYEKKPLDSDVTPKIKPIEEAVNYEKAYNCANEEFTYKFDRKSLVRKLNRKVRKYI